MKVSPGTEEYYFNQNCLNVLIGNCYKQKVKSGEIIEVWENHNIQEADLCVAWGAF